MSSRHPSPWHHEAVQRRFVDLSPGQVHLRVSRTEPDGDEPPLLMLHASPASSLMLVPLLLALAQGRRCIAPDTLGFGDSVAPLQEIPEASDYAAIMLELLDELGLEQVDLYGSHTGAHIAVELAILAPTRIRRLVLDGVAMFDAEEKARVLADYAPAITPDIIGSQFNWAWHFVRDQAVYFPYFRRDKAHLRQADMVGEQLLHVTAVDVLKALWTYHLGYRAAFRHKDRERLPLVRHRTLMMADVGDPLHVTVDLGAELIPDSVPWTCASVADADGFGDKVRGIDSFLRTGDKPK
jgi:pimeloyl-ACP methyl ester carboxylesterase